MEPSGDVAMCWLERVSGAPVLWSARAQRMSAATGARVWGDDGVELRAATTAVLASPLALVSGPDGVVTAWLETDGATTTVATSRRTSSGSASWTPGVVTASQRATVKSGLVGDTDASGTLVLAWEEGASPLRDVRGQAVTSPGTLGSPTAACPADFNGSGEATVQDIFDFLSVWSVLGPGADFNASGAITVQDIFDFLASWVTGCP
jgi:hypothetical protein